MADPYCLEADVQLIFGDAHVDDWAKMDPADSAPDITARILRACVVASAWIDDVLRSTSIATPAVDAEGNVPTTIVDLAARLAGLWLYEANGADEQGRGGEPYHRMSFMRTDVQARLEAIRTGVIKVDCELGG